MKKLCFLFLFVFHLSLTYGQVFQQDTLLFENFDTDSLDNWTVSGNSDIYKWKFDVDGMADDGANWDNRSPIQSPSGVGIGHGAAVLNADNIGILNNNIIARLSCNSVFNFTLEDQVFVRFYQYFRKDVARASLEVSNDGGATWIEFIINENSGLDQGQETTPFNLQVVNISSAAASQSDVRIRFTYQGSGYFWIIDDVLIHTESQDVSPIPYLGDSLKQFEVPYDIGPDDWPYVPNQVVVDFAPNVLEPRRQELRDSLGFVKIDSCCGDIELWVENGDGELDPGIGILEKTEGADSTSDIDDIELNIYNFNNLYNGVPLPSDTLPEVPSGIRNTPDDAILIAVLDTGIDYMHPDLQDHIWENPDTSSGPECKFANVYIGWNFVHDTNNPLDDHSHGTHVAGIIVQNMENGCGSSCDYRIIPMKTHDSHGVSNLFDVTCATYYCVELGVDIINDSWGYYGTSSRILKTAMEKAEAANIVIVTASGNDSLDLDNDRQFPACDTIDNIITVGSHKALGADARYYTSNFSNRSGTEVNILAMGEKVLSTVPGNLWQKKSGTSMATPVVTAALAKKLCGKEKSMDSAKDDLMIAARREPLTVGLGAKEGAVLDNNCCSCCPKVSFIDWCRKNWIFLSCIFLAIMILYMRICWKRTRTLFRYIK